MSQSSVDMKFLCEYASFILKDLHEDNDYVYLKRFRDESDYRDTLAVVFGKNDNIPKILLCERRNKCEIDSLKDAFTTALEQLKKLCPLSLENFKNSDCQKFYILPIQENLNIEDLLPELNSFTTAKIENKQILNLKEVNYNFDPLIFPVVNGLISSNQFEVLENCKTILFRNKKLIEMFKESEIATRRQNPVFRDFGLKFYNSLGFWDIVRTKGDIGLFLIREADDCDFDAKKYKKGFVVTKLSEITKDTRLLISDQIPFKEVCMIHDNVHEVVYEPEYALLNWVQSSKSVEILQGFKIDHEMDERSDPMDISIKILHGPTTCGKTLYLKNLQENYGAKDRSRWTHFVNGEFIEKLLLKNPNLFDESAGKILHEMFEVENQIERNIFGYCTQIYGKLVLLIDNFDDLDKKYFEKFAKFLESVRKEFPFVVIWVTTRSTFKNILVRHLPVFSHEIPELGKDESLKIIRAHLPDYTDDDLMDILERIGHENCVYMYFYGITYTFCTNPFNIYLCAEKVLEMGKDTSLYCLDVYDFYIKRKCGQTNIDFEELCKSAAHHFVKTEAGCKFEVQFSDAFPKVFGKFADRTILEYLTAVYLTKNPALLTREVMFDKFMRRIVDFVDRILFKDSDLATAVLNGNLEKVIKLSEVEDPKSVKDIFGRNLLHVTKDEHSGILLHLIEKGVSVEEPDDLLKWSSVRYASERKFYNNLEILLKHSKEDTEISRILTCDKTELEHIFVKHFNHKRYTICHYIADRRQDMEVTPYIIFILSYISDDDYPKDLVLKVFDLAKKNGINKEVFLSQSGDSALHNAASNLEIVRILVEEFGYDVNSKDDAGLTPLFQVTSVDVLEYLISKEADPLYKHNGRSLFHVACMNGNLDIVKYYLENLKVDINILSSNSLSPLHYSTFSNNLELVKYLYEKGCRNINECDEPNGETPLHYACNTGNYEIVTFLLEKDANPNIKSKFGNRLPIDMINSNDEENNAKLFQLLLEKGSEFGTEQMYNLLTDHSFEKFKEAAEKFAIDWLHKNTYGDTMLHYCAQYIKNRDLIEYVAKRSSLEELNESDGATSLHLAFSLGNIDAIHVLLKLGADIRAVSKSGETMMHFAARTPKKASFEILFEHDLDINARNSRGRRPAHCLASCGDGILAKYLIQNGMEPNAVDDDGMTALHLVCERNPYFAKDSVEICLRDLGVDSQIRDKRDRLALHYAVENDNLSIIKTLAKYDWLDIHAKDANGDSPLGLALKLNFRKIYDLLCDIDLKRTNRD